MKSVKRYDGKIEHCDNGGYVTFADYKKLEARLENAEGRERKHCKRAETAEAELERLKGQEPDYIRYDCGACGYDSFRVPQKNACPECNHRPMAETELFTRAAPADPRPAVLPEKVLPYASNDKEELAYARGYNDAVDKALALGCQPQRFVVKLPPVQRIGDNPGSYFNQQVYDAEETRDAIRAAGGEIAE